MKTILFTVLGVTALAWFCLGEDKTPLVLPIPNGHIDYKGFLEDAAAVGRLRAQHRITEEQFLHMMTEPDTIVLDARSDDKFNLLHIKGAKHLSLTNVTAEELAKIIPNKNTRILIYCNNNFDKSPIALAPKNAKASLNIYTFNTLYSYGYKNVFELGPFIDIHRSILPFAGHGRC